MSTAAGVLLPLQFLPAMRYRYMYLHKVSGRVLLVLLPIGNVSKCNSPNHLALRHVHALPHLRELTCICRCSHDGQTFLWRDHHDSGLGYNCCISHDVLYVQILELNFEPSDRPTPSLDSADLVLCLYGMSPYFIIALQTLLISDSLLCLLDPLSPNLHVHNRKCHRQTLPKLLQIHHALQRNNLHVPIRHET